MNSEELRDAMQKAGVEELPKFNIWRMSAPFIARPAD